MGTADGRDNMMAGRIPSARERDYRVDAMFAMPGVNLQLRTYHHETPTHGGKARADHVLSVSLSGRPRGSTGRYIHDRGKTQPFHFGNIMFVPGGIPIVGWGPGGMQHTLSCRLDYGAFAELALFEGEMPDDWLLACGDIRAPRLWDTMRRLAAELRAPGFAHETMIDLLVRTAIVDVVRHVRRTDEGRPNQSGGLSPIQLGRLTDYIANSLDRSPTIADRAQICSVSAGHLMRSFRQSTGETIHAHVQRIRIERARVLLADRNRSIKEIADLLGFGTPSSFAVAFRRLHGQSPTAFRRTIG